MKLHADNSNVFTSYWSHEQCKYNEQAEDPLNRTSGAYCSLQTPKSARLLFDAFAGRDTTRVSRSVEDAAFDAQRSRQLTGRRWRSKIRAREPSQGSRGFTRPKESLWHYRNSHRAARPYLGVPALRRLRTFSSQTYAKCTSHTSAGPS